MILVLIGSLAAWSKSEGKGALQAAGAFGTLAGITLGASAFFAFQMHKELKDAEKPDGKFLLYSLEPLFVQKILISLIFLSSHFLIVFYGYAKVRPFMYFEHFRMFDLFFTSTIFVCSTFSLLRPLLRTFYFDLLSNLDFLLIEKYRSE